MKEMEERGEIQKSFEIEVDRLFRLKELKNRCMVCTTIEAPLMFDSFQLRFVDADFSFSFIGTESFSYANAQGEGTRKDSERSVIDIDIGGKRTWCS